MFAWAVGGSAVYGAMTVAQAAVLGQVTARVVVPAFADGRIGTATLLLGGLALFAVSAVKAGGVVIRRIAAGAMNYRLEAGDRRRVTTRYLYLPLSWQVRQPTGRLLSHANADVEASWAVIAPLPMAIGVLVMIAVASVAMVLADPVLAAVSLLTFPAVFAVNFVYRRRLTPHAAGVQHLRAAVSAVAHESLDGAVLVKTLGREGHETARFRTASESLRDAQIRYGRLRGFFDPVIDAIPGIGVLIVLYLGTLRLDRGLVTTAELVQVAYLFALLAFPLRVIGWVLAEMPRSVVGWDRVRSVLDVPVERRTGTRELVGEGPAALEVRDLSYRYDVATEAAPQAEVPAVLRGVSFEVPAGRTTAVVGATGSGKSTLTSLLVRLFDPTGGSIRAEGVDLTEIRADSLAEHVALVPQQAFAFADTVRANVTLGADRTDEEVWAALRRAHADQFVVGLPDGLDSVIGERGTTLSGGQRQRLALARALVRRPRLLVLDDATSAVDPRVEADILAELRQGRDSGTAPTLVVVAYRRATIALADEVVHLEGGRIAARGTHAELLASSPGYRDLVTAYERDEAHHLREPDEPVEVPA